MKTINFNVKNEISLFNLIKNKNKNKILIFIYEHIVLQNTQLRVKPKLQK